MQDVRQDLAHDRPPGVAHGGDVEAKPAVSVHELEKAGQALRAIAPDGVELRRGVQAGLVGLQQPQQAVALEVALAPHPFVMGDNARLASGISNRRAPSPGQHGRLDRRRHQVGLVDDVVVEAAHAAHGAIPEDRVADEAVLARRAQQRAQLLARAIAVEAPPHDRAVAGVPVPLPAITLGAGPGIGELDSVAATRGPVGGERLAAALAQLQCVRGGRAIASPPIPGIAAAGQRDRPA